MIHAFGENKNNNNKRHNKYTHGNVLNDANLQP